MLGLIKNTITCILLLPGQVWDRSFSKNNINSAFESTGIYPVSKLKYPRDILNPRLLKIYDEGKRDEQREQVPKPATPRKNRVEGEDITMMPMEEGTSQDNINPGPSGTCRAVDRSFEQILVDHFTPPSTSSADNNTMPVKRRLRVDPYARVLTMDDFHNEIEKKAAEISEKEKKKVTKTRDKVKNTKTAKKNAQKRKVIGSDEEDENNNTRDESTDAKKRLKKRNNANNKDDSELEDENNTWSEVSETESENSLYGIDSSFKPIAPSTSDSEGDLLVNEVQYSPDQRTKAIANPKADKYYLVSYGKELVYVGKIISIDENISMKFLKRYTNDRYDWPKKDQIEAITPEQIVCGPIKLSGSLPFTIKGVVKAEKLFRAHKDSQ